MTAAEAVRAEVPGILRLVVPIRRFLRATRAPALPGGAGRV